MRCLALIALSLALTLASPLPAAPLPRGKTKAPQEVGAGRWQLSWGGEAWALVLHADGSAEDSSGDSRWVGEWRYFPQRRELWLREKPEGDDPARASSWMSWTVKLCPSLSGTASVEGGGGQSKVAVRLKRAR